MAPYSAFEPPRRGAEGRGCLKSLSFPCRGGRRVPAGAKGVKRQGQKKQSSRGFSEPAARVARFAAPLLAKAMASKLLRAVILGPPGSGKGTVCQRIAQNFGLQHLSSGHFLRENIKANTGEGATGARGGGELKRDPVRPGAPTAGEGPGLLGPRARPPPSPLPPVVVQAPTCRGACSRWPAAVRLNRARGAGRGSLGGGWEVRGAPLSAQAPPALGKAGNHPAEGARTKQLTTPSSPLALLP